MSSVKQYLPVDVLVASQQRISNLFDSFERLYVSFSAGKDSTLMLHLVADEARRRGRRFGLLLVDLEGQYALTIEHGQRMFKDLEDCTDQYWCCLPIVLRNAVSQFTPRWNCWDPTCEPNWVRRPPAGAITDPKYFPWFTAGMEFEEFVPAFAEWYGQGRACCCCVGIRCDESLNRWRTIANSSKETWEGLQWTTKIGANTYNAYPIYDWSVRSLWAYFAKTGRPYNKLYDRFHQAGLTLSQMRICQPFGDDQRKGLWLYQVIEPETWAKLIQRTNGVNGGSLYAGERGNINGMFKVSLPPGHTWESFTNLILSTMPTSKAEHFKTKIAVFLRWHMQRGYPEGIPDAGSVTCKKLPSWARICRALLRNDWWMKGLSFTQHKTAAYAKYLELKKRKRNEWNIYPTSSTSNT